MPLGYIVAGPISDGVGVMPTLLAGASVVAVSTVMVLCLAEVRTMRRTVFPERSRSAVR